MLQISSKVAQTQVQFHMLETGPQKHKANTLNMKCVLGIERNYLHPPYHIFSHMEQNYSVTNTVQPGYEVEL